MQNRSIKKMLILAVGAVGLSVCANRADAALTITLSELGFAPLTFTDTANTGADASGYILSYGTFKGLFGFATSNKLATPTPTQATLQITALLTSSTPGVLTISTSDNGFTFPGVSGSNEYMDSVGSGTLAPSQAGDLVTFQSYATATSGVAASNVSAGTQIYTSPGVNPGAFSFQDPSLVNTTFVRGTSFDLTNVFTVALGAANEQANLSGTTTVAAIPTPEPVSGMAIVAGIAGLAMRRRRTV